jgi:hypothetical protein
MEQAALEPDFLALDQFGNPILDEHGNLDLIDFRLSGAKIRFNFFFGTGVRDRRLVVSSNKIGLRRLPAQTS